MRSTTMGMNNIISSRFESNGVWKKDNFEFNLNWGQLVWDAK